MTAAPPPLAPDLAAGLRRLKLAAMRQLMDRAASDHSALRRAGWLLGSDP